MEGLFFNTSDTLTADYNRTHGEPKHPKDLVKHDCIINTLLESPYRWNFIDGKRNFSIKANGRIDANNDAIIQVSACSDL